MSSASRKTLVNTAARAIAMRAILALAIMGLADAFQTCNEFCDLASRGHINALCRPDCLCSIENELRERSLDIIIKRSNVERTQSLDDSPIFYEPAEAYPYGISLDQPFFLSPSSFRKAIIPNTVNKKLKRSGIVNKLEYKHTNNIKRKQNGSPKLDVDKKELPLYLDIDILKVDNSALPTHNDFRSIKELKLLEQSFKECIDLKMIANSRKDSSNNQFMNFFYNHKIGKYSGLSDTDLRTRINKMCKLPVRVFDESLKEIRRSAPKKSTERTKMESTTKPYIENILQSRQQHSKKKTAVHYSKVVENSLQHSLTTEQPDSSIYYIKTLGKKHLPEITTNQYKNELIQLQLKSELDETTSTPYIQKIVNTNTVSSSPLTLSTINEPLSTLLENIGNSVTESAQRQHKLEYKFIDIEETATIDSFIGFETTVAGNRNNSFLSISKEMADNAIEVIHSTLDNSVIESPQTQHTLTYNFSELKETATPYINSLETAVESKTNSYFFTTSNDISTNVTETKHTIVAESTQRQHTPASNLSDIKETATVNGFETTVDNSKNSPSFIISNIMSDITPARVNTSKNIISNEGIQVIEHDETATENINYSVINDANYLSNSTFTEQTNAESSDIEEITDISLSLNSDFDSTVAPSVAQTLFEDKKQYNYVENNNDLLHETSNIINYFTYLESMGSSSATNQTTTPNESHHKDIILNATTESIAPTNEVNALESLRITTDCTDTTSNSHNQDKPEKIKETITTTPGSALRVEYIQNVLDIPTIQTREFTNETVVSKITGFETIPNNVENLTSIAELAAPNTLNVAKESVDETLLEEEIVGDLYIVFKEYYIPARFIQDAKGKIKLGIDGATLCKKIAQKGLNNSLIWSTLCNCSQSQNCTNNVFKELI